MIIGIIKLKMLLYVFFTEEEFKTIVEGGI